ncbi:hypothetical protein LKD72_12560 [Fusicatenibacter sp. CLA-AA-H213]|nr:hypothetical protein [Fusicatenibacter sp. CLA-AA-H213]
MSLIVHTIVRDGIVVSADTRTTCKDGKGRTRYDDSAEKIIPFPNYIVVSHCGDSKVTDSLTVTEFLCKIRKSFGKKATISDLPLKILNEYIKSGGKGDTTFKISGYYECMYASTYTINTVKSIITLSTEPCKYGASYNGITDVAHSIMNSGIDYNNLSITDAIDLTRLCVETNIKVFGYHNEQSIGGKCQIYVIDMLHDTVGWIQTDGTIIPDKNAPNDALEQYRASQIEKIRKQMLTERN